MHFGVSPSAIGYGRKWPDWHWNPSFVDPRGWEHQLACVFERSWLGTVTIPWTGRGARPFVLDPLGVPLVETRDAEGETRVLSNVCTHRAAIVCEQESTRLRCPYHGRQFALDGRAIKAPGFGPEFPSDEDHLPAVPTAQWGPVRFLALRPSSPFPREVLEPWFRGVPLDGFTPEAPVSYEMPAHWALYCDNFLEGLHIPFVHPALQASVASYRVETFAGGSVPDRGRARGRAGAHARSRTRAGGRAARGALLLDLPDDDVERLPVGHVAQPGDPARARSHACGLPIVRA
jgi:phenylpropionate dioxygenase-like ring-hydroxylating dioxygenase large terminal subunit